MATPDQRLAEALGALSLATDLAAGQPKETAIGATIVSTRMARLLGLSEKQIANVYYSAMVRFLGCTSTSAEAAEFGLGNDQALYCVLSMADPVDAESLRETAERWIAPDAPEVERAGAIQTLVENMESLPAIAPIHCGQAQLLCSRLPIPSGSGPLLTFMYARWDGKLSHLSGDETPIEARIILLALYAELYRRAGGIAAAIEFVKGRSGSIFDPSLCTFFEERQADLYRGFDAGSLWELLLVEEPGQKRILDREGIKALAQTFGDLVDQKSGWCAGHSHRVVALSFLAGEICGLSSEDNEQLRLAAAMHDIGRMAIPNAILNKPKPLTPIERLQFQSHSYQTEQILSLIPTFERIARLAASAHEHADGSGFHRGVKSTDASPSLLAAANTYADFTQDRPWRDAYSASTAADKLLEKASTGKLTRQAVNAVLTAAGHGKSKAAKAFPAGLTRREIDVLALITQGRTTNAIADRLTISPKTADHHIQSIYKKTGVRGRAAVSLFALQNEIFNK